MDDAHSGLFSMLELKSACTFDLNMVSCIVCFHTTFEMVELAPSDDRRVAMCKF